MDTETKRAVHTLPVDMQYLKLDKNYIEGN